jgi:hypothetical protein
VSHQFNKVHNRIAEMIEEQKKVLNISITKSTVYGFIKHMRNIPEYMQLQKKSSALNKHSIKIRKRLGIYIEDPCDNYYCPYCGEYMGGLIRRASNARPVLTCGNCRNKVPKRTVPQPCRNICVQNYSELKTFCKTGVCPQKKILFPPSEHEYIYKENQEEENILKMLHETLF